MSAKTSNQPGRRTPLSLSGGLTKGQANNAKGGGNSNANGHSNNNKQDNKNQQKKTEQQQQNNAQKQQQQQQADTKENPGKMQNKTQNESKIPKPQTSQNSDNANKSEKQQQVDNKKTAEKQQNGLAANNKTNNANSQQQAKDKQQQQPSVNDVKTNEKDKKVMVVETPQEKPATEDKPQSQDTPAEKEDKKSSKDDKKEQQQDSKKEEGGKKAKEDIKENDSKKDQKSEADNKTNVKVVQPDLPAVEENAKEIPKEAVESMDVVEEVEEEEKEGNSQKPGTPSTPKSAAKENSKNNTPKKTPNKVTAAGVVEKTPTKQTTTTSMSAEEETNKKAAEKTPVKSTTTKREVTTAIDDFEMEPLTVVDQSPSKVMPAESLAASELAAPSATSTPGKILLPKRNVPTAKTDVQLAMQSSSSPERPRAFSQISGRRGIRPITDYTPSKFQSNPQFRESYRRINTELDATNTSLNVTVGSEVPNNSSFSFFGRGRKRERTPPHHQSQSAIGELPTDMDISPPKRARLDFFSVVSSPLTLLRNRFSKANLQSSTPVKLQQKMEENEDDIVEVQNVSGVSVHEDIEQPEDAQENSVEEEGDTTLGVEAVAATGDLTPTEGELEIGDNGAKTEKQFLSSEDGDIKITVTDTAAKNKRCIVM